MTPTCLKCQTSVSGARLWPLGPQVPLSCGRGATQDRVVPFSSLSLILLGNTGDVCLLKTSAAWIRRAADTKGDHPSSATDLTSPVHWPTRTKETPALHRFAKDGSDPVKGSAKPPRTLPLRLFCYQISVCEEPSVDSEC